MSYKNNWKQVIAVGIWKVGVEWRTWFKLEHVNSWRRVEAGAELVSLGVVPAGCQDGREWL